MKIKRTKTVIFTLIAALAVGYGVYQKYFTKTPIYYLTDTVKTQDLEVTILADGKLEASEQVEVGAQVSGQIKKLHVKLGDVVTKGQLLAEIDDLPLPSLAPFMIGSTCRLWASQKAKRSKHPSPSHNLAHKPPVPFALRPSLGNHCVIKQSKVAF